MDLYDQPPAIVLMDLYDKPPAIDLSQEGACKLGNRAVNCVCWSQCCMTDVAMHNLCTGEHEHGRPQPSAGRGAGETRQCLVWRGGSGTHGRAHACPFAGHRGEDPSVAAILSFRLQSRTYVDAQQIQPVLALKYQSTLRNRLCLLAPALLWILTVVLRAEML